MSDERSARLALPLLQAGQAQKDITHNEALTRLDLAVAAAVKDAGGNVPPAAPDEGACWLVGPAPTGDWAGHAATLAGWTAGGWRFVVPTEGMTVWNEASRCEYRFVDGAWEAGRVRANAVLVDGTKVIGARQPGIAAPTAGTVIDAEARESVAAILAALRAHGLIAA